MPSSTVAEVQIQLRELSDPTIAEHSLRFFKTGPGQYGEGDQFLGIRMPVLRRVAKQYRGMSLSDTQWLLQSPVHEERMLALLILVLRYEQGDAATRKDVFDLYRHNIQFVNNWDLVDGSAHRIVGDFLRN